MLWLKTLRDLLVSVPAAHSSAPRPTSQSPAVLLTVLLVQLLTGLAVWGAIVVGVPAVDEGRLDGVFLAVVVLIPLAAFELVAGLPAATQALERVRRSAAPRHHELPDTRGSAASLPARA